MEKSCKENELVEIEMTELIEEVKEWKARGYVKYPRGHTECRSTREILDSVVAGSQGYLLKKHGVTCKMQRNGEAEQPKRVSRKYRLHFLDNVQSSYP
jgi:hypothetical protein